MATEPAASSDRFQLLVNAVTDYAIYMLDADGRIATWNPGARRFKGYTEDEIIGEHFSRFFTPEDREARLPWRALETAEREGRFESEGWRVRKTGERFWAHVVIDPVWAADGRLIGYAKITRDITDRRAAENALYDSEQRFRLLVQGVRDYAIYLLDPTGKVSNWNAGAEAIKGYKAEEIVGQHFSRFYTEEDRAAGLPQQALDTALREGKFQSESTRCRKDGTRFWASVVIDPVFNEAGEHIGFAKITRDITERKQAEVELEETREALAQAQKLQALGELTGGIAHDFNNLMTVIRGSAELLKRVDLAEDRRIRYLDAIIGTADRAAMLTSHLLAFSRRQPMKPDVVDLGVRLDAFVEVIGRTFGSTIVVKLDLAPGLWRAQVDPTHLETALLNAAINARDAMPDGGTLSFAATNRPASGELSDMVEISVADTGEGMAPEVIARAFEPFFTTKPVGKGTGLGLSQIHGFAAQSGGWAEIDSTPGQGSTVRILLPRTDNPLLATEATEAEVSIPAGLSVLLVEDNLQVAEFACHLLEDLGCTVKTVFCGEEAVELLGQEKPDLLFSDVVMPGMNGIELARHAQIRWPELPILLASGYSDEVLRGDAQEYDLIRKPYGRESLTEALARLTRRPAAPAAA